MAGMVPVSRLAKELTQRLSPRKRTALMQRSVPTYTRHLNIEACDLRELFSSRIPKVSRAITGGKSKIMRYALS